MKTHTILLALALALASGCVRAQFHSKTGLSYPSLTHRAVIVNAGEARAVIAAGGELIGTITSDGTAEKSTSDLADKAAELAAKRGGTHVVMTDSGAITMTSTQPATSTQQCTGEGDTYQCTNTYTQETTTTSSRPTAEFAVLRVAPERWERLPPMLRPALTAPSR